MYNISTYYVPPPLAVTVPLAPPSTCGCELRRDIISASKHAREAFGTTRDDHEELKGGNLRARRIPLATNLCACPLCAVAEGEDRYLRSSSSERLNHWK